MDLRFNYQLKRHVAALGYFVFLMAGFLCPAAWALQTDYPAAQQAGLLLQLPVGARAVALGQGISAAADGLESISWNPAGMVFGSAHEIFADYALLYEDVQAGTLGYAFRIPEVSLGIMATYLAYGTIERNDLDPFGFPVPAQQNLQPSGLLLKLGCAGRLSRQVTMGLAVKWLREDLIDRLYHYFSGDLGVRILTGIQGLRCSAVVRNIGRPDDEFSLPINSVIGLAYELPLGLVAEDRLMLAGEVELPEFEPWHFNLGIEYRLLSQAALQIGYRLGEGSTAAALLDGFSVGLGVKIQDYALEYAYRPGSWIGDAHRISLVFGFGPGMESELGSRSATDKKSGQYLFEYLK